MMLVNVNGFKDTMFKTKNFITPITTLGLYFNRGFTTYTNVLTPNVASVFYSKFCALGPVQFLTDFCWTYSVDICAFNNKILCNSIHNNLFFNYKFDLYVNNITSGSVCDTNSFFFFNRVWLEREVGETFNIKYRGIKDTRPLLLNYGDETGVLLTTTQVQTVSEVKSNWHCRKVFKNVSVNVEL